MVFLDLGKLNDKIGYYGVQKNFPILVKYIFIRILEIQLCQFFSVVLQLMFGFKSKVHLKINPC